MHRVLQEGGTAVVQDMNHETSGAAIADEVRGMRLGRMSTWTTRWTLAWLRRRVYTRQRMEALAAASAFGDCEVKTGCIGMEVRLWKPA
jgi:hypothetical protein